MEQTTDVFFGFYLFLPSISIYVDLHIKFIDPCFITTYDD